jgi:hypothetical protein
VKKTNLTALVVIVALVALMASFAFAGSVTRTPLRSYAASNRSVQPEQVKPAVAINWLLYNAAAALTTMDLGFFTNEITCASWLTNASGLQDGAGAYGVADTNTSVFDLDYSIVSSSMAFQALEDTTTVSNTLTSGFKNTTEVIRWVRPTISSIQNVNTYLNIKCVGRPDW